MRGLVEILSSIYMECEWRNCMNGQMESSGLLESFESACPSQLRRADGIFGDKGELWRADLSRLKRGNNLFGDAGELSMDFLEPL